MEAVKKKKGFMMACKEFFGYRDEQTLKGFADEMTQVDMSLRKEIHAYLQGVGIECESPSRFHDIMKK